MPDKGSAKRRRAKRPCAKKPFVISERERAIVQNWEAVGDLPPKLTAVVEACGMSTVYDRLAAGEYEAVKDGPRTKISTDSIKRRRAALPRAEYKPLPLRVGA
jgi:hypothetical protein